MGSPEGTKAVKEKKHVCAPIPLTSPSIAEVVNLLTFGSSRKPVPDSRDLSLIFEEMRKVLRQVVRSVDKPLEALSIFVSADIPARLKKERAMAVFNGYGTGLLSLALDRAGYWFVEIFGESGGKAGVQRVDSWDLGTLVLKRIEESIPAIPDGVLADPEKASGKELKFLEDVLRYAAVVHFVAQCHETMMRAVEEQEKRLRIIRERVGLIGQLAGALDPLQSGRRTAKLPHCAMYLEHNLGTSAVAGTYFSRAALQPFWEFVKGRLMPAGERYSESVGASSLDSLETFSFLMRFCFKDIREALERGRQGADSVFGYSSGRLPLTPDEVEALKEFVTSLE